MTVASGGGLIARVLLDSPLPQLDRLFDYAIPPELAGQAVPGVRVRVPLRSAGRSADGYLVELAPPGDYAGPLSALDQVVSPVPVLAPEVWELARRVADRAAGSASDILRVAIPPRQVRVEKAWLAATHGAPIAVVDAEPVAGYGDGELERAIAADERLALDAIPLPTEVAPGRWVGSWAATFAALAAATVAGGRSAILAVPDYRDLEQLATALAAVLPTERVVRVDAHQPNPDRYRAFLRCRSDEPLVVIGNRSAVYAPARDLGLLALWDDGDPLHAEPLAPGVHARDAALVRQELQGGALVLAGHSRSTEVERLVEVGWLRSVSPRPGVRPKVIPTAQQAARDPLAARARIPSTAWQAARQALEAGPVLVQVARPGYSPRLACAECGQTARCRRCEGPLVVTASGAIPSCSWCGALAVDWSCAHCASTRWRAATAGATRTAEELGRAFPGVRVIVADGERSILEVDPTPALVIATRGAEPIAPGGYRAVLLLDGERMLARESLRVAEDCLRWWSNATALAARGAPTMLVGVGGALATALATWSQADFARTELADRRRLRFPPAVRVATVSGAVDAVAGALGGLAVDPADILGPVDTAPGTVRSIVRFDYAEGPRVAAELRAAIIRAATSRRPSVPRGTRPPARIPLRARLDDVEPFLEQ